MNIGSILYNSQNNSKLGVIVYKLNDRYILFKLENDLYPIFSKLPINDEESINYMVNGNINETVNQNFKLQLLKYYRQHKLTETEKKILTPLMNFAYPNGIPEYNTTTPNTDEELKLLKIQQKLKPGNCFLLNTTSASPFEYLNEKKVFVLKVTDTGVWVGYQDLSSFKMVFLPYNKKAVPSFHGISKITPMDKERQEVYDKLKLDFQNRESNDVLYNTIHYKNSILKLDENHKIVSNEEKYKGKVFDFLNMKIKNPKIITNDLDFTKNASYIAPSFNSETVVDEPVNELNTEQIFIGGDNNSGVNDELISYNQENENYKLIDNEKSAELKEIDESVVDLSDMGNDNMINNEPEMDLEIIEDGFEILDTVIEKVQQKPVPELEKVLDESIQMSNIRKYKIDKIPRHIRMNNRLFQKLSNNIEKSVNVISFMKAETTNKDNTIKYKPDDFKPLVEYYMDYDYQNNFLVPLVVNNKRIFLKPNDKVRSYDNAVVDENMLSLYKDITNLNKSNKKRIINYQNEVDKTVKEVAPYLPNIKPIGLSITFGEGQQYKINNYRANPIDNDIKLESVIARLKIDRINQDTEVIRFGNGKDYEFDNFGGLWDNNKFYDSYKMCGPLVYFKEPEPVDLAVLEQKVDKHTVNVNPNYDVIYRGDITNLVGFIRMPIMKYINGGKVNKADLHNEEKTKTVYLDDENLANLNPLDNPDKYIIYVFKKKPDTVSIEEYADYLNAVIPSIDNIIESLVNNKTDNLKNNYSTKKIMKFISQLNYYINDEFLLENTRTSKLKKITFNDYNSLNELLMDDIKLHEDINKVLNKNYKTKKPAKLQKQEQIIVKAGIIDLCNKIYENKLETYEFMTDKEIISHYRKEVDNGYYFELLLQKAKLDSIEKENDKQKMETDLAALKMKFDGLMNAVGSSEAVCRSAKKPSIILYDSVASVMADNGRIINNSKGKLITQGDYGYVEKDTETGTQHLFQRNTLTDGDYWIEQPISELNKLITEATSDCRKGDEVMEIVNENCSFDMSKLECMAMDGKNAEIEKIENEIKQLVSDIELIDSLPSLKDKLDKEIIYQEDKVRLLGFNKNLIKEEESRIDDMTVYDTSSSRKQGIHMKAINAIRAMKNITDNEMYMYYYEIINQFQDIEHTNKLNLEKIELEDIDMNYVKSIIDNDRLLCKHYLWAAKNLLDDGKIDYEAMKDIYGEENNGSFYCRICGVWLVNSETEDNAQFGKSTGNQGKMLIQRDIIEEQDKNLVEKNRLYIENLINETLRSKDNNEDIKLRMKLFVLMKNLSGIKNLLAEDELRMVNYIKAFNYTPKSNFVLAIKAKFATAIKEGRVSAVVIEKYADKLFKQSYLIELAAIFLIILQCGDYNVYNKFAGNMIMGFPLLNDDDKTGINFIARIITLMAEVHDFIDEWKMSGDSNIVPKIAGKIYNSLTKTILKDEFLTSHIEKSLNRQFEESSFEDERKSRASNNLKVFRPKVGKLLWTPDKDISVIYQDNFLSTIAKNTDYFKYIIESQIDYSSMNISSLIYSYLYKLPPANPLFTRNRISNTTMCMNFNKLSENKSNKYINPAINYYNKIFKNVNGIEASIKKIRENTEVLRKIKLLNELSKININTINNFYINKINIASLNLDNDEIKFMTNKYITQGPNKGEEHIFNKYDICVISNEEKTELQPININEFPSLLNSIQQKKIKLLQNKKYSTELSEILEIMENTDDFKLTDEHSILIIDNYNNNIKFRTNLYNLMRQYKLIVKMMDNTMVSKIINAEIQSSYEIITSNIVKLVAKVILGDENRKQYLSSVKDLINKENGKKFFNLLTNMNTLIQNKADSIIDKLTNDKMREKELENILINIGNMTDIIDDYEELIRNQESVVNYIYPINFEKKTEEYGYYISNQFLDRMLRNLSSLVNMIIFNNWINEKQIPQYHYKFFFKYGASKSIFKQWSTLLQKCNGIFNSLNIILEGNADVFNYEYIKVVKHYTLLYLFEKMIKPTSGKKEKLLKSTEPDTSFSFYNLIDTNLETGDEEETGNEFEKIIDGGDASASLIDKIETQKMSSNKIAIEFVNDFIDYISGNQQLYNNMNNKNINRITEETRQKQIRQNLDTLKALNTSGYDTDYNLIMQRMKMGSFSYNELYERVKNQVGDDFIEEHVDKYNTEEGGYYDLGDADYDPVEHEEIGFDNMVEAEDMEGDGVDYGFMVIS